MELTEKIKESIHIALGEASMCWSETPKGEFQSNKAIEIGNKLIKDITEAIQAIERKRGEEVDIDNNDECIKAFTRWQKYIKAGRQVIVHDELGRLEPVEDVGRMLLACEQSNRPTPPPSDAVEFAEWVLVNGYEFVKPYKSDEFGWYNDDDILISREDLYQQFLTTKQK